MVPILLHAAFALLIVLGTLAAYDRVVVRPAQRSASSMSARCTRQKEAEFTQLLTRATTDADREKAFALARTSRSGCRPLSRNCRATAPAWWC